MSSILDALNKRRSNTSAPTPFDSADEGRLHKGRQGRSRPSWLRTALWVVSTVAVCSWAGLFLLYRLSAMGFVADRSQGPPREEPVQPPQVSPDALAVVPVVDSSPASAEPSSVEMDTNASGQAEEVKEALPSVPVEVPEPPIIEASSQPATEAVENVKVHASVADSGEFHLTGIMHHDKSPMAIINGRLVGVGQQVEGHQVLAIYRDGVRLEGQANLLRMHE